MNDELARQLLVAIGKQNKLLDQQLQQRGEMLARWKKANAELAKKCGSAAKVLAEVYRQMLEEITEATENPEECLNSFTMHEFIDKYGPRLIHLTNMVHTFEQLGS